MRRAGEINDVSCDRQLASERQACKTMGTDGVPELEFGACHGLAHLPSMFPMSGPDLGMGHWDARDLNGCRAIVAWCGRNQGPVVGHHPLCPAGHLPLKGGDRQAASTLPMGCAGTYRTSARHLISPLEGEMPGRAEGVSPKPQQQITASTPRSLSVPRFPYPCHPSTECPSRKARRANDPPLQSFSPSAFPDAVALGHRLPKR